MVFSSLLFLSLFLPVTILLYSITPAKYRNFTLLILSLLFYAYGEPVYVGILLFSTVFDYMNGRLIEHFGNVNKEGFKKAFLVLSIVGNLSILAFFKYADLAINTVNILSGSALDLLHIALPIGISFYTFQTMSYSIDVYRGEVEAEKNIINFGMYVCLFPQLIAGPIVRYSEIHTEINNRELKSDRLESGLLLFIVGLGKKVLLANNFGAIFDSVHEAEAGSITAALAIIGALAYSLQIYFDFSGYSDMAIGLGRIFGFTFPDNFLHPYESKSASEFFRRWHVTLGRFFREYVYIPLGGNRKGIYRQIFNLLVVWSLTGLWHGAEYHFIAWGLYYFVILAIEKVVSLSPLSKVTAKIPSFIKHIWTLVIVMIGWVIFSMNNMGEAISYLGYMVGRGVSFINNETFFIMKSNALLFIIGAVGATSYPLNCYNRLTGKINNESAKASLNYVGALLILILSIAFLVKDSYNPFLYFRF